MSYENSDYQQLCHIHTDQTLHAPPSHRLQEGCQALISPNHKIIKMKTYMKPFLTEVTVISSDIK